MGKIAVIGICGNSIFLQVDHFHDNGETLVADSLYEEIGGKGINQAIASARMGSEVSFLAAVGDDANSRVCERVLKENHIKSALVHKSGENTAIACILTDITGENRVTEYIGATLNVSDVEGFEIEIASADILLLQQEVPAEVNQKAIELAHKHGVRVILNPAPPRNKDNGGAKVFLVTPNEHESRYLEGLSSEHKVVTLGKEGCVIDGVVKIPAINIKSVDSTGAGDTFNGILASCITEGMSLEQACRYAVAGSGISVSKNYVLGAIPYRKEIERMMKDE